MIRLCGRLAPAKQAESERRLVTWCIWTRGSGEIIYVECAYRVRIDADVLRVSHVQPLPAAVYPTFEGHNEYADEHAHALAGRVWHGERQMGGF